jgi:hypothetical protein
MLKKIGIVVIIVALFTACGGQKFEKTPLDQLVTKLDKEQTYSVVLHDMDIEEHTFSETYKHRYKVITTKDSVPQEQITEWYKVSEPFFARYQNDLGMEIMSKSNGKISKVTAPPGYSTYVGNAQYGQWRTGSDGSSFWEFYGKYAMMSSMLGLASSLIHRNSYYDYRDNYYGRQPYYGTVSNGVPSYGTLSTHSQQASPSFHQRAAQSNSFKDKISNRVSRSNSAWGTGSSSSRSGSSSSGSSGSSWFGRKSSSSSSSSSSGSSGSSWFGRKSSSSSSSGSSRSSSSSRSSGRSRRR